MSDADQRAALLRVVVGRPGPVVPDAATWREWKWLAQWERVAPLLYQLIDLVPTDLTDEQREEVRQLHGSVLLRCIQLEHHMLVALRLLDDHGIRGVALKGGATAHLDYPNPSWREVSDIDVLIDPADRIRALQLLRNEGWVQGYALPKGHDEFTHAVTLVKDRMELDLHQRIGRRALGLRVPTRELLEGAVSFDVAGAEVFALNDVDRLIHSALHCVSARGDDRRLSSVADVLLGAHRRADAARDVLERAERWRVRLLVEQAVLDAFAVAQLDAPEQWVEAMRRPIHRRDRLVEGAYLSDRRARVRMELAYLRLLRGWRTRWRYVVGYFKTDSDYVQQHRRSGVRAQSRYVLAKLRGRA